LSKRYECRLQMGGSDQWGNIVNGIDLGHRLGAPQLYALTSPLLTTASGAKMGKTASGAVWLNPNLLSAYDFWQFWRNTMDADVGRFLKLYTEVPLDEVARLEALAGQEINEAKIRLANEVTTLAHGAEAAATAEATARETFEAGGAGADLPTVTLEAADFGEAGLSAAQLFLKAGLAASGKEAKRLIAGGGAQIDDRAVTDPGLMLPADRFAEPVKLTAGKKRHALARLG
ncbi:MAG: tyrosine--tRNA ligase, partial [Pseudomonadota bacterium]